MKPQKLAAIDIGSNAMRMLIVNVVDKNKKVAFKKSALIRIPIRLGQDVFQNDTISDEKKELLCEAMKAYKHLMKAYQIKNYRACATSAMRDAKNGQDVVKYVKEKSGIKIETITGEQEASIIYNTQIEQLLEEDKTYLYVDVGGGSTELTLYSKMNKIASHSFQLGTVRIIQKQDKDEEWKSFHSWLREYCSKYQPDFLIGSGGNINKLLKMVPDKPKSDKTINLSELQQVENILKSLTYEERIEELGLNPDRADVIIPAMDLYLDIMRLAKCHTVMVPKIGLADGMIKQLYEQL